MFDGGIVSQVVCGDCADKLADIPDETIDLIVTSPPYANRRAKTYGGVKPDEYVDWFLPISAELLRVLKPEGTFVLNIKEPVVKGERHSMVLNLILGLKNQGWRWTEEFIWHKRNSFPGKWPNRFRDSWERLLQFNKQAQFEMNQEAVMVPVGDWYKKRMENLSEADKQRMESSAGSGFGKNVSNWAGRDMAYPTNVLHRATVCHNKNHSAAFPGWLPDWFIDLFSSPGGWVLDPFAGSGTTLVSAALKGRHSIGIEQLEEYCSNMQTTLAEQAKRQRNSDTEQPRLDETV